MLRREIGPAVLPLTSIVYTHIRIIMKRIPLASLGARYSGEQSVDDVYDVIVVGSGMGGLAAASLLAQRGSKVLILEQNDLLGGCTQSYERRGYRWNVGVHYIGSVGAPTITRRLFDAVCPGIEWSPLPSIYNRIAIADREYEVPAGGDAYRGMLARHFPHEEAAIDRYLSLITSVSRTARGYFAQKALPEAKAERQYDQLCAKFHTHSDVTTDEALRKLTDNAELRGVWTGNWGDYGLAPHCSSFAMHCMLVKHYMDGAWFPVGGPVAFAAHVLPLVEAQGGRAVRAAEVDTILVERGAVQGVRLVGGQVVKAPIVVSNAGIQNTYLRLLDRDLAGRLGLVDQLSGVGDSAAVVGINLGLNRSAEDLDLRPANIWAHPGVDFKTNVESHTADFEAPFPLTFMTFPSTRDPDWNRDYPSRATVELYGFTNFDHFSRWVGSNPKARGDDYLRFKAAIGERLLNELSRFAPKVRSAIDVMEVSTPISYERFLRRAKGGFMGLEASPERFRARWLRSPTPISGLYLSGQDVTSDGVIGALTGGLLAASAVLGEDLMQAVGEGRLGG